MPDDKRMPLPWEDTVDSFLMKLPLTGTHGDPLYDPTVLELTDRLPPPYPSGSIGRLASREWTLCALSRTLSEVTSWSSRRSRPSAFEVRV